MWTKLIYLLRRSRHFLLAIIIFMVLAFSALRFAAAQSSVVFLSEKIEGTLIVAAAGGGYQTEQALHVIVQNDGAEPVYVSFCLMPDGENACPRQGLTVTIGRVEGLQSNGTFRLEPGRIKDIRLTLAFAGEPPAAPRAVQAQAVPEASPVGSPVPVSLGKLRAVMQDGLSKAGRLMANEQPTGRTGLLILRVNGNDADAIPYSLMPRKGYDFPTDWLTTKQIVTWTFILASLAILLAIWPILYFPWLERILPRDSGSRLPLRALLQLPMGVAEWRPDDSWMVNLSVAIAILGGVQGLLPDSLASFKTSYSGLTFLFGVLTAGAAFAYNASTHPGPEREEGKQSFKKQGYTGVFIFASWLVVWALLGQLGLQLMAVERMRDLLSLEIPGLFLLLFQVLVLCLSAYVFSSAIGALRDTIRAQKIEAHQKACKHSKLYRKDVVKIKKSATVWRERMKSLKELTPKQIAELIDEATREFTHLLAASKPHKAPQSPTEEERLYEWFHELFNKNLPELLQNAATTIDSKNAEHCRKSLKHFFHALADDADEAQKILDKRLPVEEAVTAFYSSLWVPRALKQQSYNQALDKISRHLRVACAQVNSPVEVDRVIGPNEELVTNIMTALDELDRDLGLIGKKDPIYANLKKLFKHARLKWEVMRIQELESHLCGLAGSIEKCKKKLAAFFKEEEETKKVGEARLAMTLEPLAQALGCPLPYPKTFPVDTEALEIAYREPEIKEGLERMDAPAPRARKGGKVKAGTATSAGRAPAMQKERSRLQASMQEIAANPAKVLPYADPAADKEFNQKRMKALQQHSQKKVMGEDVILP